MIDDNAPEVYHTLLGYIKDHFCQDDEMSNDASGLWMADAFADVAYTNVWVVGKNVPPNGYMERNRVVREDEIYGLLNMVTKKAVPLFRPSQVIVRQHTRKKPKATCYSKTKFLMTDVDSHKAIVSMEAAFNQEYKEKLKKKPANYAANYG